MRIWWSKTITVKFSHGKGGKNLRKRRKRLLSVILLALMCFIFVSNNVDILQETEYVTVEMESRMSEPAATDAGMEQMIYRQTTSIYTYSMLQEDIITLCTQYPDIVKFSVLGQSVEGRDIYQFTLGNPNAPHAVFIQAGIHAREYMTTQLVMRMLTEYAMRYAMQNALQYQTGTYQEIPYQSAFEQTCFYIIPMSNPDGVAISQFGEAAISNPERLAFIRAAYERDKKSYKSYAQYLACWKANANGVDLNRNFNAGWEGIHQRTMPSSELYKGAMPESEPETQILISAAKQRTFDCIISYHARGEVVYYDAAGNAPEMSLRSATLANIASGLNGYKMMNCKTTSNVVLGGFGDWTMLTLGIPSITIEIGKGTCPLPQSEFESIWNSNKEMWERIACHFQGYI